MIAWLVFAFTFWLTGKLLTSVCSACLAACITAAATASDISELRRTVNQLVGMSHEHKHEPEGVTTERFSKGFLP